MSEYLMAEKPDIRTVAKVRLAAHHLTGEASDYDPLLRRIGDGRFVLIGEASHGTHEFYRERAEITKRLIREKGVNAVAAEADWPDAYRVNLYVRGLGNDRSADEALRDFKRFPNWMWRNTDVLEFVEWLRGHNASLPSGAPKVGFYGLDLYSLFASIEAVIRYLDRVDPEAASRARQRYSCFDHYGRDAQTYGWATSYGAVESCESAVVKELTDLQRRMGEYARRDGRLAQEEAFYVEQNARLVRDADRYYRAMFRGGAESWNLRDQHMVDTLDALADHLDRQVGRSKVVVWEHNSHLGDARATQMGALGELNVGQLVRERHGADAVLVGQTTYTGTVTAASEWGESPTQRWVRPALARSYEQIMHDVGFSRFMLKFDRDEATGVLRKPRLERAIGVIYLPQTERSSHYSYARLPDQFDALLHFDETRAVEPLELTPEWRKGEAPETYPYAV